MSIQTNFRAEDMLGTAAIAPTVEAPARRGSKPASVPVVESVVVVEEPVEASVVAEEPEISAEVE
jgi:hypothetical protein